MPEHRLFAAIYDLALAKMEKEGLADMRGDLLAEASGRTLELGAGTGHNLAHYGPQVTELVLSEPDPHMAKRLEARVEEARKDDAPGDGPQAVTVSGSAAEELPFPDESFDTVTATLVFCTVGDPERAVAEVRRVLKPGGKLLLIEHVESDSPRRRRWQNRLERPWGVVAGGCHPNRPTAELLARSGLSVDRLDQGELPGAPGLIRPMIRGVASRPATGAGAPAV